MIAGSAVIFRRGGMSTSGPPGATSKPPMEPQAECIPVILGATPEGKTELIGFQVGVRESAQSPLSADCFAIACRSAGRELLVDIEARGLAVPPEIAVGDGAMGFWKALDEVFPGVGCTRPPMS